MDIQTKLEKMQDVIENAKKDKARLEGKLEQLMDSLKKLGCDSYEAGEKKSIELEDEITELQNKLQTELEKLENDYDWS